MKDKIGKANLFEFNHIDNTLSESEVKTLKDFYKHYHKKYWCFKKSYKRYKILDETLTLSGGGLVVIGTIIRGITLNQIILGVINGAGVIVSSISKMKYYKKKIEMTQIAFTTYEKYWLNCVQLCGVMSLTKNSLLIA